jgi:transglutaminase-like putative cysteine protease
MPPDRHHNHQQEVVLSVMRFAGSLASIVALALVICILSMSSSVAGEAGSPPGEKPPADVFSRVAGAGTADDHKGADHLVVYDYAMNHMKPTGVTYVDSYIIYKVLTAAGCRDRSVLRWNYDPQSSYVEVRDVNIIRGGKKIPVDVTKVRDLPAPQRAIYWKDRIKTLQLPRLEINDGIEITVFRKGFTYALLDGPPQDTSAGTPDDDRYIPPMPGEYFDIVLFAGSEPIIEKKYVLSLPADKRLHSEIYNGPLFSATTYDGDRTEYSWWGLNIPPAKHETSQPDWSDFAPKAVMATAESWEAKSRWFFDVNRDQFEVSPGIQEKVDEILKNAGVSNASEEKKAKALVHWVAQNIRYSGQTMGEGEGFTLHPSTMIFEQRSGVCKDIAGMLIAMMRGAGMDSYAAMTMAGSRIDLVPADQFNHCVCALKKDDGTFEMYDPTWVPYNNSIWSLLEAEQHFLVGTPEGEFLSRIDYSPPQESPLVVRHDAKMSDDGTLEGTLRMSGSGAIDGRLRRMVANTRRQEVAHTVAQLFAHVSDRVEVISLANHTPEDFSKDMWIEIKYRIPRFADPIADGFEFQSPMMQVVINDGNLFRAATMRWEDDRETDVFLYYTQLIDGTENIRLPKGYKAVDPPSSKKIDEIYAAFKGTSGMDGRVLKISQHAEIKRRQIPPDGYGGFKKTMDEAKEFGGNVYRIEKGGK